MKTPRLYRMYIRTSKGDEEITLSPKQSQSADSVRRVANSRSMRRRLAKPGRSLVITKQGKEIALSALERKCFQTWLEDHPCDPNDTGGEWVPEDYSR